MGPDDKLPHRTCAFSSLANCIWPLSTPAKDSVPRSAYRPSLKGPLASQRSLRAHSGRLLSSLASCDRVSSGGARVFRRPCKSLRIAGQGSTLASPPRLPLLPAHSTPVLWALCCYGNSTLLATALQALQAVASTCGSHLHAVRVLCPLLGRQALSFSCPTPLFPV